MCIDPVSLTLISAGASAAGSLFSGFSSYQNGKANAAALEVQAKNREEKAKFDVERADNKFQRVQGTARNVAAASGIDVKSFYDVLADNAAESALEKEAIRYGAELDVSNLKSQAAASRKNGTAALVGGAIGAVSAVAGGYGKIATSKSGTGVQLTNPWRTSTTYSGSDY